MAVYRLYFLDAADHIRHALDIECESDEEAMCLVDKHADGRAMELWQRSRMVKRFTPAQ